MVASLSSVSFGPATNTKKVVGGYLGLAKHVLCLTEPLLELGTDSVDEKSSDANDSKQDVKASPMVSAFKFLALFTKSGVAPDNTKVEYGYSNLFFVVLGV